MSASAHERLTQAAARALRQRVSSIVHDMAALYADPYVADPDAAAAYAAIFGDAHACAVCAARVARPFGDHMYALVAAGGGVSGYGNDAWNRLSLCAACNSSKGGRHPVAWIRSAPKHVARVLPDADARAAVAARLAAWDAVGEGRRCLAPVPTASVDAVLQGLLRCVKDLGGLPAPCE